MPSLYEILGISPQSNKNEIKAAYKRLALKYHPDLNPNNPFAEECFKKINSAYQVLSDDYQKKLYDSGIYRSNTGTSTYTRSQSYSNTYSYEPYVNSYDPANYVSKSIQRKLTIFTVIFFVMISIISMYLYDVMNHRTAINHYQKALEFYEKGEYDAAKVKIAYALEFDGQLEEAYFLRGRIFLEQDKNYFRAYENFENLLKFSKKPDVRIYYYMGYSMFKLYDFDLAIKHFQQAIILDKNNGSYYLYLAKAKLKSAFKYTDFCFDLEKATSLGVKEASKLYTLHCK